MVIMPLSLARSGTNFPGIRKESTSISASSKDERCNGYRHISRKSARGHELQLKVDESSPKFPFNRRIDSPPAAHEVPRHPRNSLFPHPRVFAFNCRPFVIIATDSRPPCCISRFLPRQAPLLSQPPLVPSSRPFLHSPRPSRSFLS